MISSAAFMPRQPVIDGFEFAAAGATQQGTWPLADFPRLHDVLASAEGEVSYRVEGAHDGQGRPALRIRVSGVLQLCCQRCLEAMPYPVDTDETLVLAASVAEIDADRDPLGADRVVAGREMPVRELIEDELLLALPYAPRHEEGCTARAEADAETTKSPFAGLRGLMRGKH